MFLLSESFWFYFNSFLVILFIVLYVWLKYSYGYWKRKGIYSPPATFILGHIKPVVFGKIQMGTLMSKIYGKTKHLPYVGLYLLNRKAILINDLELVKNVFSKDYNFFQGHGFKLDKETDPITQNLFNLEGDEWKRIRVKLSPTFTSSKMRFMFETMADCATVMLNYIQNDATPTKVLEIKEILAKFSTDVIGSCAFGIQTNSFKYPDAEFRRMGKKSFTVNTAKSLTRVFIFLMPSLAKSLGLRLTHRDVSDFFIKMVPDTIKEREDQKITRNDFLQLLIDGNKKNDGTGEALTMLETTAQVFVFFLAGFETSSTAASFALFELAKNPEIQKALREDIDREIANAGGKLTYDAVGKMTYLTQVVEETLRMYPVGTSLMRVCSADYTIPGTKDVIEKDTMVIIPVMGIHRDENIYPDPLTFDPERFTPENIANRHQFAHIPFGGGPRICIGSRFGLLQVKLAVLTVIRNFEVNLCDQTLMPLEFDPKSLVLSTVGGMFLRLSRII